MDIAPITGFPWLIAGYHVFHRLLLPRHSPNALLALDLIQKKTGLLYVEGPFRKSFTPVRPSEDGKFWYQKSHISRNPRWFKERVTFLKNNTTRARCVVRRYMYLTWNKIASNLLRLDHTAVKAAIKPIHKNRSSRTWAISNSDVCISLYDVNDCVLAPYGHLRTVILSWMAKKPCFLTI